MKVKSKYKSYDSQSELSKSDYDYKEVITAEQFAQLSQEVDIAATQRQNLMDSLYGNNSWYKQEVKFTRVEQQLSPYQVAYQQWKGNAPEECSFKETYASAINLVSQVNRQSEVKRLMGEHQVEKAVYKYQDKYDKLSKIKDSYQKELQKITAEETVRDFSSENTVKQFSFQREPEQSSSIEGFRKEKVGKNIENNAGTRRKMVELAVQKQLLQRIKKINDQEKEEEEKQRKQKQYQQSCFVNMIRRPPPETWTREQVIKRHQKQVQAMKKSSDLQETVRINSSRTMIKQKQKQKQVKSKYKLNVQSILKIPHKKFLIFYSDNYRQIINLSTPEELRRLNKRRDEALQKEQAMQKLKQKVAEYGPEELAKLPPGSRQKLFRILYEKDVEVEKQYNP